MNRLLIFFKEVAREALQVSLKLYKIMIPILVGVKILQELKWISYLAVPLKPIMQVVGLPPEMGLVWATAIINNVYSAIIVFLSLEPQMSLTSAQVTVLTTMILVAHSLPVEVKIAQEAGTRFMFQFGVRMVGAFVLGWLLHIIYSSGGWLQGENIVFWQGEIEKSQGIWAWALDQGINLLLIFLIILLLIILMRILSRLKIVDLLNWILQPILRFLGIGKEAATLTIVGMTMGLTYGGGLIINESNSGRVAAKDVFAAVTLMGLCHSLIEDTLLMLMLGGHLSGLLWARLVFSLLVIALLVRLIPILPRAKVEKFLFYQSA